MNTPVGFVYQPNRQYKWEAHYSLTTPGTKWREVWEWCWETLGHPGTDPDTGVHSGWDYHGGWIKLRSDEELFLFQLRFGINYV